MNDKIYLIANNAAVDAVMITKAEAIDEIRNRYGFSLDQVATIGDEIVDIPMLEIAGLGNIGTVANAQQRVIEYVASKENGFVSNFSVFDGFMDFYNLCKDRKRKLIITDKDGVLKEGDNVQWGPEYARLVMEMGKEGDPFCVVLTGSALSQNEKFRHAYGLDERLKANKFVQENPFLLIVENGAIHLNVITGEIDNRCHKLNSRLLDVLKGPFEKEVARRIRDEILPEFGFDISYNYDDQTGKVYHVIEKLAGVSFNIPRKDVQGSPFRKTSSAQKLRDRIIEIMSEEASKLGTDYVVL
ncbi:HAD hydrolase family protein [Candidatus Woesearchaeota archaeon]|nr:HAD hydrolase family protein [Candidatus Woesearchaeota archaeon]